MEGIKKLLFVIVLGIGFTSCTSKTEETEESKPNQAYLNHTPLAHHKTALEVLEASKNWIQNFNKGNADYCINAYDSLAVLSATPIGVKIGKNEISNFWLPFISSGATNLIYTNVKIEVVNETTAFLSANFSMNVLSGIIYQEKWEKKNEKWILTYDNFQSLVQFDKPQENTENPIASHIVLENVIKSSVNWTNGFNNGKDVICKNGYSINATMTAVPFGSINGKEGIGDFWNKLITDGANNLTYHNPTFEAMTTKSVILSAHWSMNIGQGQIYQEKWEKINEKWVLTYDEFEVIKQY